MAKYIKNDVTFLKNIKGFFFFMLYDLNINSAILAKLLPCALVFESADIREVLFDLIAFRQHVVLMRH